MAPQMSRPIEKLAMVSISAATMMMSMADIALLLVGLERSGGGPTAGEDSRITGIRASGNLAQYLQDILNPGLPAPPVPRDHHPLPREAGAGPLLRGPPVPPVALAGTYGRSVRLDHTGG